MNEALVSIVSRKESSALYVIASAERLGFSGRGSEEKHV